MKIFAGWVWSGGFRIWFWDLKKKRILDLRSSGYSDIFNKDLREIRQYGQNKWNFFKKIFAKICYLLLAPLLFHYLLFKREGIWQNIVPLMALFFLVLAVSTAIDFLKPRFKHKIVRQWHACEHKLIHLLSKALKEESGRSLTIENLKRAGRTHLFCETSNHILFVMVILACYVIVLLVPAEYSGAVPMMIIYLGMIKLVSILFVSMFLSLFVGILAQYFFFTAKPTEEQFEETVRVGKEFMKEYKTFYKN